MLMQLVLCFFSSTGLPVLVVGAASTLYSSPSCLSNTGFPACFQSSSQQWHQCQCSTIPVNADSKAVVMAPKSSLFKLAENTCYQILPVV